MLPEETEVREALGEYVETRSIRDWVPTDVLWQVYKRYHFNGPQPLPGDPRSILLGVRQFGIVLGAVFPHATQVRRWTNGRHIRGRAFLTGPLALRSETNRGGNRQGST